MAYSSSIKRAQTIKLCDVCQEDSVKWRCIDCDGCLCEKCTAIHLGLQATAQHQIVTIKTPLQNVPKKIVTDNIPCKTHPKEKTCLFCKSCDSLICQECVSSSHKKHNFNSIKSALDEKLDDLRSIHGKIDANLKCCESKTSEIQNTKPKYNAVFDESLTKIKHKEQELVDEIRNYSQLLQEKVEKERSQVSNILLKIERDIDTIQTNLEDQRDEIDAILTSSQGGIIFQATMKIKDLKFDALPNQIEEFIPGTKSTKQIQEMFGTLQNLNIPTTHDLPEMELKVIRTFTTDLPYICNVITSDETTAWITCHNQEILRKINMKDNNTENSMKVTLKVKDMAKTSNNDILLTVANDSAVQLLKHSGEIVSFVSVSPLFPRGIHVTKDNDVIVGVTDTKPDNLFTLTDESQIALIVYGMDGKQKQMYQYDNKGKRLFTLPYRITTNKKQDIFVVDFTSKKTRRVVALNKDGIIQWSYEGHSKINAREPFSPRGIVTTSEGLVIVSDYESHALHVLSEKGEVLTCKDMRDILITSPNGLCIDDEGRLWLGCGTGGKKTGAKLHILQLST